jgi:stage V sporulation protein R
MKLPDELKHEAQRIGAIAHSHGLDFFETLFEIVSSDEMDELAAYSGFPIRYPHWRFGMQFDRLHKGQVYGLSHIYELVINNDPCCAYLMETNRRVDHQMVMAHVYAHCDFFKNNLWFSKTPRNMFDRMAQSAGEIGRIIERQGYERVERFVDAALSLENLIDPHSVFRPDQHAPDSEEEPERLDISKLKLRAKEYLDPFVNPREMLEEELVRLQKELDKHRNLPRSPQRDVLRFLIANAPLRSWQKRILSIIRQEAYYFAPQALTKIMNEGWATYWHTKIMTQRILTDADLTAYADHCARTLAMPPGSFNPYRVGLAIWHDIEERWNTGRCGREWEDCDDFEKRRQWDTGAQQGIPKMFEVRRFFNDVSFVDTFLTRDLCRKQKLFTYKISERTSQPEIEERDFVAVKQKLLFMLTNMGQPIIEVVDGNYENRSECLLQHCHYGVDLDLRYARETLKNLALIWSRPVHIQTVVNGKPGLLSHDGQEFVERELA